MQPFSRLRRLPLLRITVVRFGIVALFGEGLYFLLYGLFLVSTGSTTSSLALAGGICILVNAYSHSRITFRVRFNRRLLIGYLQIQLLGFGLAFLGGLALHRAGLGQWFIALVTYLLWGLVSFLLTRLLYGAQGVRPRPDRANPLP